MKRRSFIQASIASLTMASCNTPPPVVDKLPKPNQKTKIGAPPRSVYRCHFKS